MSVDTGRRPAGGPPPGGRRGPPSSRNPRSVRDRVSFKPIAVLLLMPVILATSILTAAILAPPFAAAGFGVNEIRSRLDALGSDFTRIPRFPERSTIYAADGTILTRVYLDNREIVPLEAKLAAAEKHIKHPTQLSQWVSNTLGFISKFCTERNAGRQPCNMVSSACYQRDA